MSKTKSIFLGLRELLLRSRQSGTTSLLQKIAAKNDVWVLVADEKSGQAFGDKAITLNDLDITRGMGRLRIHGVTPKPILVDNYMLIRLSEDSIMQFEDLELMIKNQKDLIKNIKHQIASFELKNGI